MVLQLVLGRSNQDIAIRYEITQHTVKDHLKNAYRKLGVHQRACLAGTPNWNC